MAAIPGFRFDITGASGSQGLLSPRESWRAYVFPRGGNAAQDSTGTLITFDSSAIASRFSVDNWIQVSTSTANIRKVTAVGGNSMSLNSAVTVTENDRIFLIGNTQPSTSGGSTTYITPNTLVRQRGDDAADLYANSMIATNANGLVQGYASPAMYDVLVQDGNGSNQGYIADMEVGTVEGVSVTDWAFFGSTVTFHAAVGITGTLGVSGAVTFGSTLTVGTTTIGRILSARGPGEVRYASQFSSGSLTGGIQEAINDLPLQGGKVVLNAGTTYTCTAQVVGVTGLHIQGAGPSSVILQTTGGTSGIAIANNMIVSDLRMIGNGTSANNAHGINGGGTIDSSVERCIVESWGKIGVNFANSSVRCYLRDSIVRNNHSEGVYFGLSTLHCSVSGNLVYGNSDIGIDFIGSSGSVINNIVHSNGTSGPSSDNHGILVGTAATYSTANVVVSGNVCRNNMRSGIFVWGGGADVRRITVTGNICVNNGVRGIDCQGSAGVTFSELVISNNIVSGNSNHGILLDGADDSVITGNIISGNATHGLYFYGTNKSCARNVASSNVIRGNSNGIRGDNGNVTANLIIDNQITGNNTDIGTFSSATNLVQSVGPQTSTLTQAATLALGVGDFFGVSGTIGAGTSISTITPLFTGREVVLWAAAGTMGFSQSNTLKIMGASFNVPVNGAVKAYCTGTTWFVFSPSS